jgi:two-component system, LytTR family, response regulator
MLKAVIVEDQEHFRKTNRELLQCNFPEIAIVGEADGVETAVELIKNVNPDLVLLDIEINGGTGFQLLKRVKPYNFRVIFITAFDDFAIKAIKFSALDYILKPVNETEFCAAIENAIQSYERCKTPLQVDNLLNMVQDTGQTKKIVLRTQESIFIVDITDILYCESDNSYTTFYLEGDKQILVSRSLKEFEQMLGPCRFFRPHQCFLVNLNKVTRVDKTEGGNVILQSGKSIPVSFRRKQALMELLNTIV